MAKSDTVAGAVEAFESATTLIKPPEHVALRDKDMPFWRAIVSARDVASWTEADLAHAATLARTQADIEELHARIDEEGWTLTNARGTVVGNPIVGMLESLTRRAIALSRFVQVHSNATIGDSTSQVKKNKAAAEARKQFGEATQDDSDDLIARPH